MRLLTHLTHNSITHDLNDQKLKVRQRQAARGILLRGSQILMMYTERYDDFSFPGGGIDANEDRLVALRREMAEEAGACAIEVIAPFGKVTEFLPSWKPQWDLMHQTSYWYHCQLKGGLTQNKLEHYEVSNGMQVLWVEIADAIDHNQKVMASQPTSMGISIPRETFVLQRVAEELTESEVTA